MESYGEALRSREREGRESEAISRRVDRFEEETSRLLAREVQQCFMQSVSASEMAGRLESMRYNNITNDYGDT